MKLGDILPDFNDQNNDDNEAYHTSAEIKIKEQ